jgi:hypothetical protein
MPVGRSEVRSVIGLVFLVSSSGLAPFAVLAVSLVVAVLELVRRRRSRGGHDR